MHYGEKKQKRARTINSGHAIRGLFGHRLPCCRTTQDSARPPCPRPTVWFSGRTSSFLAGEPSKYRGPERSLGAWRSYVNCDLQVHTVPAHPYVNALCPDLPTEAVVCVLINLLLKMRTTVVLWPPTWTMTWIGRNPLPTLEKTTRVIGNVCAFFGLNVKDHVHNPFQMRKRKEPRK